MYENLKFDLDLKLLFLGMHDINMVNSHSHSHLALTNRHWFFTGAMAQVHLIVL